uniref:Uncharacterized protein n=1 Tax=Avena sativa TaxID=4498 RepID=A0ACD5YFA1_AVESA
MVSAKRLAQMAKKWQKLAAMGRKRLTWTARGATATDECCATASVAVKGHFMVYTADGARFEVPLPYLGTAIVGELLSMSHDEFGFSSAGRITLPCDASVMEYVLRLLGRDASEEVERALLSSVVGRHCHYDGGSEASVGLSEQVSCF